MRPHLITVDCFFKAICDTFQKAAKGSGMCLPETSQAAGQQLNNRFHVHFLQGQKDQNISLEKPPENNRCRHLLTEATNLLMDSVVARVAQR